MNRIWIGGVENSLEDADPQWIHEQILARRADGQDPCVRVSIRSGDVNVMLETENCKSPPASGRQPNDRERALFDLWARHHLRDTRFTSGNVVSFVQQVRQLL